MHPTRSLSYFIFRSVSSILFILFIFLSSCQAPRKLSTGTKKNLAEKIQIFYDQDSIDFAHGFVLYDLDQKAFVFEKLADQWFTPASNTKLFTLYALLSYLPENIPFLDVHEYEAKRVYKPLADGTFLHPDFDQPRRNYFLQQHSPGDTIRFYTKHFKSAFFGNGWMWDDYQDYYHAELSPFPIHGNVLSIIRDGDGEIVTQPEWADIHIKIDTTNYRSVSRSLRRNDFTIRQIEDERRVPLTNLKSVREQYFQSLGLHYEEVEALPTGWKKTRIYSISRDTVARYMMHNSDNHLAETLLLQSAMMYSDSLDIHTLKDSLIANQLKDIGPIKWVDGSGLSRYNQFSPRSIVLLLHKMIDQFGTDVIKDILAVGGQSGTIKNWYGYDPPRVWAKTGTMSQVHCLSGLVESKSGKRYLFSFMNNHHKTGSTPTKKRMAAVLDIIVNSQ